MLIVIQFEGAGLQAQTCPSFGTTTLNSYPNTYYPGLTASLGAGSTSITLGAATYGSTAISSGDLLLIIQMQGAQIGYTNDSTYGKNFTGGGRVNGYTATSLLAGNMEYAVATNSVPLGGGTLNLLAGTANAYQYSLYSGGYGQYIYQVIRVGSFYNAILGNTITVPSWNGSTGGVLVMYVTNNLNMNGQTITAAGAGFRGGGGLSLPGGSGGSTSYFRTLSTKPFNGSKGEGIAGTPRLTNNNFFTTDSSTGLEGYPVGSFGMGAPGNAGAGGTDGAPIINSQNSGGGGGGGSNGGTGGKGGNSWSSNLATGGEPGAVFAQVSVSRLVMGGGGGAGTTNNSTGFPGGGVASGGASGGGIVIIYAGKITGTGTINVNGASAIPFFLPTNDGSGGGGAGGSVILSAASGLGAVTVTANGGAGGSNTGGGTPHGPGGGGGAGAIYASSALNAASSVVGGVAGTTAGGSNYGAVSVNAVPGVLDQVAAITSPMSCTLLPAGFLAVAATGGADKVTVSWQVANDASVQAYTVEKSLDGAHFISLGTVPGPAAGNMPGAYSYNDPAPVANGHLYYRVLLQERSGRAVYSAIVSLRLSESGTGFLVSPNPVVETAGLQVVSAISGAADVQLYDMAGRSCWYHRYTVHAGMNVLSLEGLGALQRGTYILQYRDGSTTRNTRVAIRR